MVKNILITGATKGIGRHSAEYLSRRGYRCICIGRNESALIELKEKYKDIIPVVYDLNNLRDIKNIFKQISDYDIKLDGFVHCAGLSPLMKVQDNDIDEMLNTYNINLFSFIEAVKYFSEDKYSNSGSSIVAISSIVHSVASYRQTVYASSKAALVETVKCMAKELMERKIRVNYIAPGLVNTPMIDSLKEKNPELNEKFVKLYPLGAMDTDKVSYIIEYLLSDNAKYMTGSGITMDSGFLAWK